ncbi:Flp1 family type IVb pilin [Clostridium sp. Marseille-P299]|uniref:Flp1 family type IVb pilin n=1 Tax=Clostridium sp. Marseille-P299 TaxID=1805477 RepID=UPI0008348FE6|nr:Flp1 family type IVb pilin [Clostridium sp. Marseille-P299]
MINVVKRFLKEEDGIGVVEIILILVVLIGLVLIFRTSITQLVKDVFDDILDDVGTINND